MTNALGNVRFESRHYNAEMGVTRSVVVALLLLSASVRADGAFPASFALMTADSPTRKLVLATTFQLMISEDEGTSWRMMCEALVGSSLPVTRYQVGLDGTLYGSSSFGLYHSYDNGCGWTKATGPNSDMAVTDIWADPSRPERVYAVISEFVVEHVNRSDDRGLTIGPPLWTESNGTINGVESSRSRPQRIYVSGWANFGQTIAPYIARTDDDGANFTQTSFPELAGKIVLIAAVDPVNPDKLYLRVKRPPGGDALYISTDQGATLTKELDLGAELMTGFARAADGTLFVASREQKTLWRKRPGESQFMALTTGGLRCLSEHNGTLYSCGDDSTENFALAASRDQGETWTPLTRLAFNGPWLCCESAQAVCNPQKVDLSCQPAPQDAGIEDAGVPDAGVDKPMVEAGDAGEPIVPPVVLKSCGCGSGEIGPLMLALWLLVRRRVRSENASVRGCRPDGSRRSLP